MKDYILEYEYKKDNKIYKITMRDFNKERALYRFESFSRDVGRDISYVKLFECIAEVNEKDMEV